jgi:hypothetical protein
MPTFAPRPEEVLGMNFDWGAESKTPAFKTALEYWRERCGKRSMPCRADVSPGALRKFLPSVHLYEVFDAGASYRVRLIGTDIANLFEANPTGKLFDRTSKHPLVKRMLCVIQNVARRRQPLLARARRTAIDKVNYAPIESLFLPLSENGSDVSMVLAVTVLGEPETAGAEPKHIV